MAHPRQAQPSSGTLLTLDVEKATAGGRMLARHEGQVVFVAGAIPGERIRARVTRAAKGVIYADLEAVLTASSDRRATPQDPRCGGHALVHVVPERQIRLKGDIIADTFRRLARVELSAVPDVVPSPELGYRMRARFHVRDGRVGFLRESSHELCDAGATGQLLPQTAAWLESVADRIRRDRLAGVTSIELSENVPASQRACYLELVTGEQVARYAVLGEGLTGLSACALGELEPHQLVGRPYLDDTLTVTDGHSSQSFQLSREVRAFFQGNRFLLEALASHIAALVPTGPVLDLYAGVGLLGLSLAAVGHDAVTLVEGERVSGANLVTNATPFGAGVRVHVTSVEQFLRHDRARGASETVVVDPPRTGLSPDALAGVIRRMAATIVYVSCDVATLARDTRALIAAGYRIESVRGFDLFPNTAHIETVVRFSRA